MPKKNKKKNKGKNGKSSPQQNHNGKKRKRSDQPKKNEENQRKRPRKRKRRKKSESRAEARRKKFKGMKWNSDKGKMENEDEDVSEENEEDDSFISIFDEDEEEEKNENAVSSPQWKDSRTPWNTSIDRSLPPILRLHNDIVQFTKFISPTSNEASDRVLIETRIRDVTSRLFPGSTLCVFGSSVTNLCLPGSDVDMCVFFSQKTNRSTAFDLLSETLRQLGGIADMEEIKHARVCSLHFSVL